MPRRTRPRPRHVGRRRARRVEVRSGAEAVRARGPVGRHVVGPDAADRKDQRLLAAAPRATPSAPPRGSWSAGNIFRPSAPAASAANASVGVATPGTQTSPAASLRGSRDVGMRHHDQPPARRARPAPRRRRRCTVPAPTRQRSPNRSASAAIESNGSRRIERHFEDAESHASASAAPIDGNLLGRDAAQHRDQRQRIEIASERIASWSSVQSRVLRDAEQSRAPRRRRARAPRAMPATRSAAT